MSAIMILAIYAFLAALNELFTAIVRKIKLAIKTMKYKRSIRERRGYYRIALRTRIRYKLESIYDDIITPK